jgi:uridine kinase
MPGSRPLILGVAGGSGSGKTTVVSQIIRAMEPVPVSLLHHDSYYRDHPDLSDQERARLNYDHPEVLETPLLADHLRELLAGQAVEEPVYDFTTHSRTDETRRIEPNPVVIVDGILILAEPELRELMDIRVYVETDSDLRFIRRLLRDTQERGRSVDSVIRQYQETVRPMHLEFVEPSRRHADVIVPFGRENRVAISMLVARLRAQVLEEGD